MARVFGVRLLTLDATIVLAPAEVAAPSPPRTTALAPTRFTGAPRTRSLPARRGLAQAVRTLNEGAELLADARRGG